ncbi:MAG TPA: AAA family ATPase [Bacillota bacterium]|nr:AAA family ATPase [Bacillota bacterium]
MRELSVEELLAKVKRGELGVEEALGQLNRKDQTPTLALQQAKARLNSLVGLENVKKLVEELEAFIVIQKRRQQVALATEPLVLHMIFSGSPGTGKTTVARILGELFRQLGVLPKGHLVEVERADLVGEYIGHTAQKTREQIRRALGGILFIDEAYSLARGGEKDFGKEAIDTLVKAMEDHKDQLLLILAGYETEMEGFLSTNPGLRSRFPIQIKFPDYTIMQLEAIAEKMLSEREYKLSKDGRAALRRQLVAASLSGELACGNARLVRNLIERAIRKQAVRLMQTGSSSREELMLITAGDLGGGEGF